MDSSVLETWDKSLSRDCYRLDMKLQIEKPLAGYLLDRNKISTGSTIEISTWTKPVSEAEIAIYFGKDIPHSASINEILSCISALGPAIEIADLDLVSTDPEMILTGDIFQRYYILGQRNESRLGGNIDGLAARVRMPNGLTVAVENLQELMRYPQEKVLVTH